VKNPKTSIKACIFWASKFQLSPENNMPWPLYKCLKIFVFLYPEEATTWLILAKEEIFLLIFSPIFSP